MKKIITLFALATIAACPLAGFGQSDIEKDPAYLPIDKALDLKAIPPQVNVNLPHFLLKDAISGLSNAPGFDLASAGIDLPELLKDVKLIRVVVLEVSKTNRPAVDKGVKALRAELESQWTSIVSVPDKGNNVGVYAKSDASGESMAGVAVLIADSTDVVIVNVVGRVSIGSLLKIATQSNKLPKDFLWKLQGGKAKSAPQPAEKSDTGITTNKPAEVLKAPPKEPAAN
jgi:hypothetical protein